METSIRYGGDTKALRIYAKEKIPIDFNTHLQVHGELDTRIGAPTQFTALVRRFYPDVSMTLGVGLQYERNLGLGSQYAQHDKLHYILRGRKTFPVTDNGLLSFNVKGQYHVDKEFKQKKKRGAAEFSWNIFNFQEKQDVRLRLGYEVFDKVPYLQVRENNWTLNADINGKWNVRFDL